MVEETDRILTEYVKRSLEFKGETSLRVTKLGLFENPKEAVERYRKIFNKAALDVVIECFEDSDDPKYYFQLHIQAKE